MPETQTTATVPSAQAPQPENPTPAPAAAPSTEPKPSKPDDPIPQPSIDTTKADVTAAVQRCCAAYYQAYTAAGGPKATGSRAAAEAAFKRNLPWVTDRDSIRSFVACITQGMVLGVFWRDDGTRLITAARAAFNTLPPLPREKGSSSGPGRPGNKRKDIN
jgi:hypothetical protein